MATAMMDGLNNDFFMQWVTERNLLSRLRSLLCRGCKSNFPQGKGDPDRLAKQLRPVHNSSLSRASPWRSLQPNSKLPAAFLAALIGIAMVLKTTVSN